MGNTERAIEGSSDIRVGAILLALVDIDPEFGEEFNEWYDNTHVPDLVSCEGFLTGRRGVAVDPSQSPRYIAIYEIEDESALESEQLRRVRGWGPFADRVQNYRRLLFKPTGRPVASSTGNGEAR